MSDFLKWQVYKISSDYSSLNGVMLRGRIRKFGLENNINVLAENIEDTEDRRVISGDERLYGWHD